MAWSSEMGVAAEAGSVRMAAAISEKTEYRIVESDKGESEPGGAEYLLGGILA